MQSRASLDWTAGGSCPHVSIDYYLHAHWLLASHRDWREPAETVWLFSADDGEKFLLHFFGDWAQCAVANFDFVHRAHGRNFRRSPGEENFIGNVEHFAGNTGFDYRDSDIAGDFQDGVTCNSRKHGVAERRGLQNAVAHHENIFARAFTHISIGIERNPFAVSVGIGFHANELRVHVIRSRLCHRGKGIGGQASPGGGTYIHAAVIARQIFAPRIIDHVNLNGAMDRGHTGVAIAAKDNGADITRPRPVGRDQLHHRGDQLFQTVIYVHAINFGGVEKALHVFFGAEDRRAAGKFVATHALKY